MIIDGHVHVGRWAIENFSACSTTLEESAGLLASLGFGGALVMTTDTGNNESLLAELKGYGGALRLFFAFWVNPFGRGNFRLLEREKGNVSALKFHPSFLKTPATSPLIEGYFKFAEREKLPCIIHCGRWKEIADFRIALSAAERYGADFILSHMGGDSPEIVSECVKTVKERGLPNVYLGTESIREYWLVQTALDTLGADRLIFGSDYNLNHPLSFVAVINALKCGDGDRKKILGENLLSLFRRPNAFPL
ncbi:MAG: amidohydrolase family protein [Deltaproteobacteria bacterium]|nr:amidohydrolase family protein [Deltaproteobacteria bacterium]